MLNRLNFLKNQSGVGEGGGKGKKLPVIPWKSYVNHPRFHAREEVHEQQVVGGINCFLLTSSKSGLLVNSDLCF